MVEEQCHKDRVQTSGVRQEMIGWALLGLFSLLWLCRWLPAAYVPSRMESTATIGLNSHGTEAQLRQALEAARQSSGAEATLTQLTGPQIHGSPIFTLHVTADTTEQAQAGRAAMIKAMEASAPEAKRPFRVDPTAAASTIKVRNDKMRQMDLIVTMMLLLFGSGAQVLVVLGTFKQMAPKPMNLWMKLVVPFLFLLGASIGGSSPRTVPSRGGGVPLVESMAPFLFFFLPFLVISVIPAWVILWLTRRSNARHRSV